MIPQLIAIDLYVLVALLLFLATAKKHRPATWWEVSMAAIWLPVCVALTVALVYDAAAARFRR